MTEELDSEIVWKEAERISEAKRDEDVCIATALLLASICVGPNMKNCAKFLKIPRRRIAWMCQNLRKSGIWKGRYVYADWEDEEYGRISLICDTFVALGIMEKTNG